MQEFSFDRVQISSDRTHLSIPRPTLIVLCGASGSGKSSFAARHFPPNWVISSDGLRGQVCDDERNMDSSRAAFDLLFRLLEYRLSFGRTTVVDSTALNSATRQNLVELAIKYHFGLLLLLFDVPQEICRQRDALRVNPPPVGAEVIAMQYRLFEETKWKAFQEGFDQILALSQSEIDNLKVEVVPLSLEKYHEDNSFDLIGDIHGCYTELTELLTKLGYVEQNNTYRHPAGRKVIFLGDLVNRGLDSPGVVKLVYQMVEAGTALYVRGNHCQYLLGYFKRYNSKEYSRPRDWLEALTPSELTQLGEITRKLVGAAPPYLILDNGKLIATHAGIEENMIGRLSQPIFDFCLYGEDTITESGKTTRRDWATTYSGKPMIVYGHTPTTGLEPAFRNNTINLDQGCVYGGRLTAMRYPEREFVQVQAKQIYHNKSN